jgi:hypothetical protein
MLYNLSLHVNVSHLAAALAVASCFVIISMVKERKDERKRA